MSVNSESVFDVRFAKQRSNDIGKWLRVILHGSYRLQNVCCSYVGQKLVNDVFRIYFAFKEEMGKKNHVSFWKLVRYIYICYLFCTPPPQKKTEWGKYHASFWKPVRYIFHLFCPPKKIEWWKIMYPFDKPYDAYLIYFAAKEDGMGRKSCIILTNLMLHMLFIFPPQRRLNGEKSCIHLKNRYATYVIDSSSKVDGMG